MEDETAYLVAIVGSRRSLGPRTDFLLGCAVFLPWLLKPLLRRSRRRAATARWPSGGLLGTVELGIAASFFSGLPIYVPDLDEVVKQCRIRCGTGREAVPQQEPDLFHRCAGNHQGSRHLFASMCTPTKIKGVGAWPEQTCSSSGSFPSGVPR